MHRAAGDKEIQALRVRVLSPYPTLTEQLLEASVPCIHVVLGEWVPNLEENSRAIQLP